MLLALDIGNTNIVMGISQNGNWIHRWRIQTDADKTADEYHVLFKSLFEEADLSFTDPVQIIISSVVPQLTQTVNEVFLTYANTTPLVLNGNVETGIKLETDSPQMVGADLIADAVGAYSLCESDCIVVDFGTATTVMAIEQPGTFTGVAICAGLKVTIDALVGKAAQLSQIPLEPPPQVVGRNTMESMQSGLVVGHLCMVEGLVKRMEKEVTADSAKIIATGGLSEKIGPYTDIFDVIDPMLTLDGLQAIVERQ